MKMKILKTLLLLLISIELLATAQYPDYLIYKSDTLIIYSNPLELFLEKRGSRELPDFKGCSSTACWRGYLAIWELRNDSIFLKEITNCSKLNCDSVNNANLEKLFGDNFINDEVFANWIDFEIGNPHGNLLQYIHSGYQSIYEFERVFKFKNGILKSITNFDNTNSKQSIYSQNKDTLLNFFFENIDWNNLPQLDKEHDLEVFTRFKVNKFGKIHKIKIIKGISEQYDNEARRVLRLIPEWNVYFQRGEPINWTWNLSINFNKNFYKYKVKKNGG